MNENGFVFAFQVMKQHAVQGDGLNRMLQTRGNTRVTHVGKEVKERMNPQRPWSKSHKKQAKTSLWDPPRFDEKIRKYIEVEKVTVEKRKEKIKG
jgi:hypothetical protein